MLIDGFNSAVPGAVVVLSTLSVENSCKLPKEEVPTESGETGEVDSGRKAVVTTFTVSYDSSEEVWTASIASTVWHLQRVQTFLNNKI